MFAKKESKMFAKNAIQKGPYSQRVKIQAKKK